MKLDRELQRKILEELADIHPQRGFPSRLIEDEHIAASNLVYLEELELIEESVGVNINNQFRFNPTRITAKGMDFLADDGGLSAILGTVVVKFHSDTIRLLLINKLDSCDIPEAEKSTIRNHLERLSGGAMEEAGRYLMNQGIQNLPNAIDWLGKLSGYTGS